MKIQSAKRGGLWMTALVVVSSAVVSDAQQFAPRQRRAPAAYAADGAMRDMRIVSDRAVSPTVPAAPRQNQSLTAQQLIHLAKLAEQNGAQQDAGHLYRDSLATFPQDRLVLLNVARWQHRIGELDKAIATYEECVKLFPNDAVALNDLGLCCSRAGDIPRAIQHVTAAANQRPGSQRYRNNLAILLVEASQLDRAAAVLCEVHGQAIGYYNTAHLLQERGSVNDAVAYLQKALTHNPRLAQAQQLMARLQNELVAVAGPVTELAATPQEMARQQPVASTGSAPQAVQANAAAQAVQPIMRLTAPAEQAPEVEQYPIPLLHR